MPRIVSLWLPRWPIQRFLRAQRNRPAAEPVDPERPFVLAAIAPGGPRIAALSPAASAEGLVAGDLVADARARVSGLQVRTSDPAADRAALQRVALWATRYTPQSAPWDDASGADGSFLDVTGSAHLFGGEKALLADLASRLDRLGLSVRLAIADTPGLAWAVCHFRTNQAVVLPPGEAARALAPLPIEALRLSAATSAPLRRLGFKRVGALLDNPRAPFAARFPAELLLRLDQALGRVPEPLKFATPPPAYFSRRHLLEPIFTQDAIVIGATRLMEDIAPDLIRDGVGARRLELLLYRLDGEVIPIPITLSMPTRTPGHIARLVTLKLERMDATFDAGCGFESLALAVLDADAVEPEQADFATTERRERAERSAKLIDSLSQRLGTAHVRSIRPVASHIPESSERVGPVGEGLTWPSPDLAKLRPLLLLSRAEPVEVSSLATGGPLQTVRWRGVTRAVVAQQGPERISSAWWRHHAPQPERDYYLIEDEAGRRFWVYRETVRGRTDQPPRWFMHGLFA